MAKKQRSTTMSAAAAEEETQPGVPAPAEPSSQLAVAVEPPVASGPAPWSLASRVADAAAAQLLIFDELPDDEKPRPNDRALLVGIVWGGSTLVELDQLPRGADLPVGALFDVPSMKLPQKFPIVKHDGEDHVLSLPEGVHAEIHRGGKMKPLSEAGRQVDAPFKGHAHTIGADD